MDQEEREALTHKATARILACLHQTTNVEEMIRSMLTGYGVELFAAGEHEPVVAYHWKALDREGDAVTFLYGLEQALLSVMSQQRQS
jgi:hypothetical protein